MQIHNEDVLTHIKTLGNNSVHTTFSDFPYALGSQWQYVNGVLQMKGQGKDFMNGSKGSWSIQDANWWREYLGQMFRVMKYGGYVVFYSISQQSWAFSALMVEAGFEKCQELHWANISNFPKASCASKMCDRKVGAEREVVGKVSRNINRPNTVNYDYSKERANSTFSNNAEKAGVKNIEIPATDLAKLFEGYKYGKAPLKKITEPILVFRKPCKFGSVLNDLMQCQTDSEISPAVLDIERNRVGTETITTQAKTKGEMFGSVDKTNKDISFIETNHSGRFPATLFISPEAAELLDSQLDLVTFELNGKIYTTKRLEYQRLVSLHILNNTFESCKVIGVKRQVMKSSASEANHEPSNSIPNAKIITPYKSGVHFGDSGYISRVLHQPDFTEQDFASLEYAMNDLCQYSQGIVEDTFYCPTVSPSERNEGCENLPKKNVQILGEYEEGTKGKGLASGNFHPCLKPISLNQKVFSLFLLPKAFNQVVYCPFSGTASEVIGVMQAGVKPENIISVEFNPDYIAIQKARIEYFANQSNIAVSLPKSENETQKPISKLSLF